MHTATSREGPQHTDLAPRSLDMRAGDRSEHRLGPGTEEAEGRVTTDGGMAGRGRSTGGGSAETSGD